MFLSTPLILGQNRTDLSLEAAPSGPWRSTTSSSWTDVPDLVETITTAEHGNVEITVSAEVLTSDNKRMFLRALVDQQAASPSNVIFVRGGFRGTRSFTFVQKDLGGGMHEVRVQWLVDSGGTAYVGDRTLSLYSSPTSTSFGGLALEAAPSGAWQSTASSSWTDVPDMKSVVSTTAFGNLEVRVSAEALTSNNKRMFLRALVDGKAASPANVVFVRGSFSGTKSFTFTRPSMRAGDHQVQIQWLVDAGGRAYVGDRTLSARSSPRSGPGDGLAVQVASSGAWRATSSSNWSDVPELVDRIDLPNHGQLEISVDAEALTSNNKRMFLRALIDDQVADPSNVVFVRGGFDGTQSFTFVKEDLAPGNHTVRVQWLVDSRADPSSEPTFVPDELCADWESFSLHAKVRIHAEDRTRLERLARYVARPPIATERLSLTPDGRVAYGLRRKWRDGTTHVVFDPFTFIERLAALVPRPRQPQLTYHGVLAPAASWRDAVVPRDDESEPQPRRRRPASPEARRSWAELMQRTFGIDVLLCPHCGGRRQLVALIQEPNVIRKILAHLGLDDEPVEPAPARSPPELELAF